MSEKLPKCAGGRCGVTPGVWGLVNGVGVAVGLRVSRVDFSPLEQVKAWLKERIAERRKLITSRTALRLTAMIGLADGPDRKRLGLTV
ncbi:MAG: hypothetical protein AAFP16_13915 [Pseudomonadota bacterium]